MSENVCPQCGAALEPGAAFCNTCGAQVQMAQPQYQQQAQPQYQQPVQPQPMYQQPVQPQPMYQQPMYVTGINPAWPVKSKLAAGLLGIFLGGLGIHKFYLGQTGMGILYLLFCWTCIPEIVGFIEGIVYLCESDENFQLKNHVRIG